MMQQAVENPDVISLAAGLVDSESLPVEPTRRAVETLLGDPRRGQAALQYGTTAGSERLRDALLEYLARLEGVAVNQLGITRGQLVLTSGSQQLLSILGEVLLDPGDICLVGGPSYFVFLGTLEGLGARAVSISSDHGGMRLDALEETLEALRKKGDLPRVKMVYVVSYFDNPCSVSLEESRRAKLVELVERYSTHQRIHIIEDAAYRELRYEGDELPSLWSLDPERQTVVLAQTFSKCFSPGLRVGFGVLPAELVDAVSDRKGNEDFGSPNFNQHLLSTVFEEGLFEPHVDLLREIYRTKRDCLVAAASESLGDVDGVEWAVPQGGLYLWMSLPTMVETGLTGELFRRSVHDEGVMFVPGDLCYGGPVESRPRHQMRLSFGVQPLDGLREGMARLARAIEAVL